VIAMVWFTQMILLPWMDGTRQSRPPSVPVISSDHPASRSIMTSVTQFRPAGNATTGVECVWTPATGSLCGNGAFLPCTGRSGPLQLPFACLISCAVAGASFFSRGQTLRPKYRTSRKCELSYMARTPFGSDHGDRPEMLRISPSEAQGWTKLRPSNRPRGGRPRRQ
jgi:hypothetical protein